MSPLVDRFRTGFRRHAAGVTIVAAVTDAGPVGATVSSVASVSADPPILSFSLDQAGTSARALAASERVSVYTLTADHVAVAAAFAHRSAPRFTAEQGWTTTPDGALHLAGATATLRGRVAHVVPAGASWLLLVEVDDVELGEPGAPLLHHDRAYWTPGPLVLPPGLRAVEG